MMNKSSLNLKVLSHEGSILHPKMAKIGLKHVGCTGLQKFFQRLEKVSLGSPRPTEPGTIEQSNLSYQV